MQFVRFIGNTDGFGTSSGAAPTILVSSEASVTRSMWSARPGWGDVRDRIQETEADPAKRKLLIDARKRMAHVLSERGTLTFLRIESGLSKRDLAALIAIPEAMLSRLEVGAEDPRVSVYRRLAQALDLSLDEIAVAMAAKR